MIQLSMLPSMLPPLSYARCGLINRAAWIISARLAKGCNSSSSQTYLAKTHFSPLTASDLSLSALLVAPWVISHHVKLHPHESSQSAALLNKATPACGDRHAARKTDASACTTGQMFILKSKRVERKKLKSLIKTNISYCFRLRHVGWYAFVIAAAQVSY